MIGVFTSYRWQSLCIKLFFLLVAELVVKSQCGLATLFHVVLHGRVMRLKLRLHFF